MSCCPPTFRITSAHESSVYKMQQQQHQQQQQQQNNLKIKRSFKRRRFIMAHLLYLSVAIIAVTMTQNMLQVQAVPALVSGGVGIGYWTLYDAGTQHQQQLQQQQLWHQRYKRDVGLVRQQPQSQKENLKDSLQQSSSTEVSLEQPQGQCLLDGEYVPETTVFCEKQVGCRAIQKTGHCCPDYKCDCQKDGKTYLNGDKLVDPETPCTVCYCQGGEILCSSVTCFHRDDCTPKYIPGVCCPEYDNCPVATSESSLNKTLTTTSTTAKPEIHQAENNHKITIKEITKPIEIRITDDNKAIPIHQMLKPSTTSTTTTTTTTTTSTIPPPPAPSQSAATNSEPTKNSPQTLNTTTKTFASTGTQTLQFVEAIKQNPSSLSLENNPSTNESLEKLSTDNAHTNKNGFNGHKGGINGGDTLKLSASVAYPTTIVNMGGSTETTSAEVEDPVPALSVFSTQGLPEDPSKVNIKREYFITTEGVAIVPPAAVFSGYGSGDYPNTELIYSQTAAQGQASYNAAGLQPQTSGELDPDTAGSDNIYHIILTTDGPRLSSTTENYLALKGVSTTEGTFFEDLTLSSLSPVEIHNKLDVNSQSTTEADSKSTTESALQQQHLDDEDSAIPLESNPAYPSLPEDDFSLRDNNFQINDSDDIGDEPRSIGGGHHGIVSSVETFKATKHLEDTSYGSGGGSGSGSGSVLIADELPLSQSSLSSSTEGSGDLQSSTESYEKLKPAEVVQFMYSGEDSSEETRITNSTDFKLMMDDGSVAVKGMKIMDTSLESSETQQQQQMEFEMGSGSGEIKSAKQQQQQPKEREPTTARPKKHTTDLDIDEVHDASGSGPQDDPKLDVESLKVDENANDYSLNTEKSSKNNVLSVKVQPSQEKQLHDDLH